MKESAGSSINEAFEKAKKQILTGVYRPSEALTESTLCADLGVSRTTVKKVLLMLAQEGLVTVEQNKSCRVKSFSLDEIIEMLEVRAVLERYVMKNAVTHMRPEALTKLDDCIQNMKRCVQQRKPLEYSGFNNRFHQTIYNLCTNKTASDMVLQMKAQISRYDLRTILLPGRDEQSLQEHTLIYEALRDGASDRAADLIEQHVRSIQKLLTEHAMLLL